MYIVPYDNQGTAVPNCRINVLPDALTSFFWALTTGRNMIDAMKKLLETYQSQISVPLITISFVTVEYTDEDLHRYIHEIAKRDKVMWSWLDVMVPRIFNEYPCNHFVKHHEYPSWHKNYGVSDVRKLGVVSLNREYLDLYLADRKIVRKYWDDWVIPAIAQKAGERDSFLLKLPLHDENIQRDLDISTGLYNRLYAPMFKNPTVRLFTVFDEKDPYYLHYHIGIGQ